MIIIDFLSFQYLINEIKDSVSVCTDYPNSNDIYGAEPC